MRSSQSLCMDISSHLHCPDLIVLKGPMITPSSHRSEEISRDVATATTTRRLSGHMGKIHVVEFNDDASVVASGALFDLFICFPWN
jgi:hypothetical protein